MNTGKIQSLAQQGNTEAIATILNHTFSDREICALIEDPQLQLYAV